MDYFDISLNKPDVNSQSILALAHLGDGVYELMVRTFMCINHKFSNHSLHEETLKFVNAAAQNKAFQKISSVLSEEELSVYTRGRNAKVKTVPKHANRTIYQSSTGFEALWGYLYLCGRRDRLNELFAIITDCKDVTSNNL